MAENTQQKKITSADVSPEHLILLLDDPHGQQMAHKIGSILENRSLKTVIYAQGALILILTLGLLASLFFKPILALDAKGRLVELQQKNADFELTDSKIKTLASDFVLDAYDFNYLNYQRRLDRAADLYLMESAKAGFRRSMREFVGYVVNVEGFLSVTKTGDAVIKGFIKKKGVFVVEVPVKLETRAASIGVVSNQRKVFVHIKHNKQASNGAYLEIVQVGQRK